MVVHHGAIALAALIGKGAVAAGHAVGHYWAAHTAVGAAEAKAAGVVLHGVTAHPLAAGVIGAAAIGGPILTIAYLDKQAAIELISQNNPNTVSAKTVKFSVAGRVIQPIL